MVEPGQDRLLLEIPTCLLTERLHLRCYRAGDGPWYHAMSLRNRAHLARYEGGNAVMNIDTAQQAEATVRGFAAAWAARDAFFMGAFLRASQTFVAQVYVGSANWELPEFCLGYFADVDHQGHGYVTEAARGALHFAFAHLGARRVRLECDENNLRSSRVAERCGMVCERRVGQNRHGAGSTISGTLYYGLSSTGFVAGA